MTHPPYIREKALQMRIERRMTIDEIAERLALPRTTIYHWVRHIEIERKAPTSWPESAREKGNQAMCAKYRALREAAYAEGVESWADMSSDPTFRDFVCLYIAEGYKRNRNRVSIANSDPAVMVVSVGWLRRVSERRPDFALQYHADQDLAELRAFWAGTLGIDDPGSISLQRKSNSNQLAGRTWRSAHGVLSAGVNDTLLRSRLQGWIDCIRAEWT